MTEQTDEMARLRDRVAQVEEQKLNAVDALIGAEAAAAQARRDIDEIFHRLHLREEELKQLKEALGHNLDTPNDEIIASLDRRSGR